MNAGEDPVSFALPTTKPDERWEMLIDTTDPWAPPRRLAANDRYQLQFRSMAVLRLARQRKELRRSGDWGPMGVY